MHFEDTDSLLKVDQGFDYKIWLKAKYSHFQLPIKDKTLGDICVTELYELV